MIYWVGQQYIFQVDSNLQYQGKSNITLPTGIIGRLVYNSINNIIAVGSFEDEELFFYEADTLEELQHKPMGATDGDIYPSDWSNN